MYQILQKHTWKYVFYVPAILLWSTGVLSAGGDSIRDSEAIFSKLYRALAYIYFPGSQENLDDCYIEQEERCIRTYKRAIEAKNKLFSYGHEAALDATLSAINANCKGGKRIDDAVCKGAVYFLFFFNSRKFDEKIFKYFLNASDDMTQTVFESGVGHWMHNRIDNSNWIKFINSHKTFNDKEKDKYKIYFTDDYFHEPGIKLIKKNTAE